MCETETKNDETKEETNETTEFDQVDSPTNVAPGTVMTETMDGVARGVKRPSF
jgi:hypothetical protein